MRKCSRCFEAKDEIDFPKSGNVCKFCRCEKSKLDRLNNSDKINSRRREKYIDRKDIVTAQNRIWQENNREQVRQINRDYYAADPSRRRSYQNTRRARVKKQTPNWLTKNDYAKMEMLYSISRFITRKTGVEMAVDHIIPINGKNVSGFNMPENMQVITKLENEKKGNRYG